MDGGSDKEDEEAGSEEEGSEDEESGSEAEGDTEQETVAAPGDAYLALLQSQRQREGGTGTERAPQCWYWLHFYYLLSVI